MSFCAEYDPLYLSRITAHVVSTSANDSLVLNIIFSCITSCYAVQSGCTTALDDGHVTTPAVNIRGFGGGTDWTLALHHHTGDSDPATAAWSTHTHTHTHTHMQFTGLLFHLCGRTFTWSAAGLCRSCFRSSLRFISKWFIMNLVWNIEKWKCKSVNRHQTRRNSDGQ